MDVATEFSDDGHVIEWDLIRRWYDGTGKSKSGVGNSFGFEGRIRDMLGIRGLVHVLVLLD